MYHRGAAGVGSVQTGTVKSWNGGNGYGFIECPGAGGDIMFLRTSLPPDCKEVRGKFLDGKQVQFEVKTGNNGKSQAENIQIHVNEGDFLAGRIKTFSDKNGYGFIESSMMPGQDVRFGMADFKDMMPGVNLRDQLVIFQVMSTPDGKQRVSKIMFQSSKIAQNVKAHGLVGATMGGMGGMGGQSMAGVCPYFAKGQCTKGNECRWSHGNQMPGRPALQNFDMGGQMGGMKRGAGAMGGGGNMGKGNGFKKLKTSADPISTGQHASGIIKSYNAAKAFGFITADGLATDVFFMRTDLPVEAQSEECIGCGVNFEVMNTPDGKLRANNITSV